MPGLLGDGFNDPRSAAIMALAGNMVRGDFGGGLLGAQEAYQGTQDGLLKRQLVQQQLQEHDIALAQAKQKWAIMGPAMQQWAAQQGNQPTASPVGQPTGPSQPNIAPLPGGPLGSGTAGIPMGGQSASAPAPQSQGNPAGGDRFSLGNVINGAMIGNFGGPGAETAYWASQALPDSVKTNNYYGLDKGAVSEAMARENAAKGNMLVRGQSTVTRTNLDGSVTPIFSAPDTKNNSFITWDKNGQPQSNQIQGLAAGIRSVAGAQTAGAGDMTPYSGLDAKGNPLPVMSRTAAVTQGQDDPNSAPPTPAQRAAKDIESLQREISRVPRMLATPTQKKESLDILNQQLVQAQAVVAQAPQQSGPAPVASPGAVYSAPPMGAVTNADKAQGASAQTMHDSYTKLQAAGSSANGAVEAIDKMLALASKKWPATAGAIATNQDFMNPEAAEYGKQRANLNILMAQQGGTNGSDAGRALTGDSIPDYGKPKAAIADGLSTLKNQIQMVPLKRDFLTQHYQSGDSKKYTTLENQFDQNVSPSMVPLLTMPAGPQRAAALKAAASTPAMKARLNWAAENGLFK